MPANTFSRRAAAGPLALRAGHGAAPAPPRWRAGGRKQPTRKHCRCEGTVGVARVRLGTAHHLVRRWCTRCLSRLLSAKSYRCVNAISSAVSVFLLATWIFFASPATINMPVRNSPVTPPATISGALGAAAILEATTRPIVPARVAWAPINWQPENTQVKFDPIATLCPSHSQGHQLLAA